MTVMVRKFFLEKDLTKCIPGIRDFVRRMDYSPFLPEKDQDIVAGFVGIMKLDLSEAYIALDGDEVVGGIGFIYAPNMWNPSSMAAEEIFWWVDEDAPNGTALKLLRHAELEAKEHGCTLIVFKRLTSSPATIDKVYTRMGLRPVETAYMGVL